MGLFTPGGSSAGSKRRAFAIAGRGQIKTAEQAAYGAFMALKVDKPQLAATYQAEADALGLSDEDKALVNSVLSSIGVEVD